MTIRIDKVRAIVRRAVTKGKVGRRFANLVQGACNHALSRILDGAPPKRRRGTLDPQRSGRQQTARPRNRKGAHGCRPGYWDNFTSDNRRRPRAPLSWRELWRSRPSEAETLLADCVADVTCRLLECDDETRSMLREPLDTHRWVETTTTYRNRKGKVSRTTVKKELVRDGGFGLVRGFWKIVYAVCSETAAEYFRRGRYSRDWPEDMALSDNRDTELAEQSRQLAIQETLDRSLAERKDGHRLLIVCDCLRQGMSARRIVKALGMKPGGRQTEAVRRMVDAIRRELAKAERFAEANLDWIDVDPVCPRITTKDQRRQPVDSSRIEHWFDDINREDSTLDVTDKRLYIQADDPIEYFDPPLPIPQRAAGRTFPLSYHVGRLDGEGHIIRPRHATETALTVRDRGVKLPPTRHGLLFGSIRGLSYHASIDVFPDSDGMRRGHEYAMLMSRRQPTG